MIKNLFTSFSSREADPASVRREFAALELNSETIEAVMETNSLARQLRSLPEKVFPSGLVRDRDRLLNKNIVELLNAFINARRTEVPIAQTLLVRALANIRSEILRIMAECQAHNGDALAVQSRFFEQKYATSDPFDLPSRDSAPVPAVTGQQGLSVITTLREESLDGLLPVEPTASNSPELETFDKEKIIWIWYWFVTCFYLFMGYRHWANGGDGGGLIAVFSMWLVMIVLPSIHIYIYDDDRTD